MATRFNGKTYEKAHKKSLKSLESDSSIPRHSQEIPSQKSDTREDYSLIAEEVARLINPVIESTINTAVDKLQFSIKRPLLDQGHYSNVSDQMVFYTIFDKRPFGLKRCCNALGPIKAVLSKTVEASLFVHQLENKWLNSSKSIRPIPNPPKLSLKETKGIGSRKDHSTQGPSKEPRCDLGGTQRSRSRSRSPFSSIKISPPPSSEDDVMFES
ncbi:hypothetical protein XELAEV_18020095mg [Xenopus laevis]|uniref:Uncharacterized protein n=1 Tax=Xenopus laevis TaxID=8355 RepID=A0A974D926_XENLA|nr:hypothetical protein XELAEV_18020095mg [Xenopus laevis]